MIDQTSSQSTQGKGPIMTPTSAASMSVASASIPFAQRHIGVEQDQAETMAKELGYESVTELLKKAVPTSIQDFSDLRLPQALTEEQALRALSQMMGQNKVKKSLIGMGYFDSHTPKVIQRNILENPSWYTQYTPYQAEIAQGRLEALVNFQTMVMDLTGLPVANASLLDEATGAAEAMNMAYNIAHSKSSNPILLAADDLNPQTLAVVQTRAKYLGYNVLVQPVDHFDYSQQPFAVMFAYPGTYGYIADAKELCKQAQSHNCLTICVTDLLALALLESPGSFGVDIAVGNSQRFGVPLGYGGPHAGFMATKAGFERKIPGRMVGVSHDRHGKPAYRLALATREQHIRRDKATSNICTAQVLLAIMAGMYAVYHGPEGIKAIAKRTHFLTRLLAAGLKKAGYRLAHNSFFDTITLEGIQNQEQIINKAHELGFNLRPIDKDGLSVSLDETSIPQDVTQLLMAFGCRDTTALEPLPLSWPDHLVRHSAFLSHPVFLSYHTETELTRYIKRLERRDLSLTHSMIPLGSCTMKLNATSELIPITWEQVNHIHPFAPLPQAQGYRTLFAQLEDYLAEITGFDSVSLQPNSGAQGEYAGLLVIRRYQEQQGQGHRNICLIPTSAHGTNPASAALAGLKVVPLTCDEEGNIDFEDLERKVAVHQENLSSIMITYPSTHGVFEEGIKDICQLIHKHGGQVYMDGANLQAQIGLCRAGNFGPDVCHLNLHKTFCIPHGGGGPGMGPIAVKKHLSPHLPNHPVIDMGIEQSLGTVSAAPWGSASILPISWMYIRMMASEGLKQATRVAIVNANYIAAKLRPFYNIVYTGQGGLVAHECIIDLKPLKKQTGITEADVAKRLMDYGFHAPTMSWPVAGTMMIEPTESESKPEIDRFIEAMIAIRAEIDQVALGTWPQDDNPVKNAPHTAEHATQDDWRHPYSRQIACFPLPWVKANKFWPFVGRIDDAFGDRNFTCSCPPWGAADVTTTEV